jgi:two-component system nitrate/nitrite response regulator NarL
MNIAFVGGSRLLRGGLKMVLEQGGAEVVAEYRCSDDAVRRATSATKPLVYLLKHSPGACSIRHEIRTLRKADPEARIAVLAEKLAPDELIDVFASGGDGLLLEEIGASALHESLKLIALGEKVFPSQLATLLSGRRAGGRTTTRQHGAGPLTERESQIVRRLAAGLSNKEIAKELDLALATVKVHVKSLLKKLGLSNRTQAAIWALNAGIAEPPAVTAGAGKAPGDVDADDLLRGRVSSTGAPVAGKRALALVARSR